MFKALKKIIKSHVSKRSEVQIACPVCQHLTLHSKGSYEICRRCSWEDDPSQYLFPDSLGANKVTLNQAIRAHKEKID